MIRATPHDLGNLQLANPARRGFLELMDTMPQASCVVFQGVVLWGWVKTYCYHLWGKTVYEAAILGYLRYLGYLGYLGHQGFGSSPIHESSGTSPRKAALSACALPEAMKMDFVPYIESLFPAMLMGITGDKDQNEDTALIGRSVRTIQPQVRVTPVTMAMPVAIL